MRSLFLALALFLSAQVNSAEIGTKPEIKVYHDPDCQCCRKWVKHLEENHFAILDFPTRNMASVKEAVNLPPKMASCHTAIIDDYIIEGHVPADDILRLLTEKPHIAGLSVSQMPVGTPGMEMGERRDPFIVFQFDKAGDYSVYNQYQVDENNQYYPLSSHD